MYASPRNRLVSRAATWLFKTGRDLWLSQASCEYSLTEHSQVLYKGDMEWNSDAIFAEIPSEHWFPVDASPSHIYHSINTALRCWCLCRMKGTQKTVYVHTQTRQKLTETKMSAKERTLTISETEFAFHYQSIMTDTGEKITTANNDSKNILNA